MSEKRSKSHDLNVQQTNKTTKLRKVSSFEEALNFGSRGANFKMQQISNMNKFLNTKLKEQVKTVETNSSSTLKSSTTTITEAAAAATTTAATYDRNEKSAESLKSYSCSSSIIDMLLLLLRFKNTCEMLLDLIIPNETSKQNVKFFQAKFNCLNNVYQVIYKFIEIYSNNLVSLDICAASKSCLLRFFGKEVRKQK